MIQEGPNSKQPINALSPAWMTWRLFGFTLASDFPFTTRLIHGSGFPDLTFTCANRSPLAIDWDQVTPVYSSPFRTDDGESTVYLYRLEPCDVLRFPRITDFYLWPDRITCHLLDPAYDHWVELRLLATVLSFWLQRQGLLALHASAMVVDDQGVAFLSHRQSGKSTLAAAFLQDGYPLLTDDVLPVEQCGSTFVGRPGYPQIRLWPDQAQYFLDHYENLELVLPESSKRRVSVGPDGFGAFCDTSQPLACLYLPERREPEEWGTEIEISPVSPRAAVFELMRRSFRAYIVETKALGLQAQRFNLFADLALQVPTRRLVYPSGLDYLPAVRAAILRDLSQ